MNVSAANTPSNNMTLEIARTRLLYVWLSGSALSIAPLIYQTVSRTFERTTETGTESFAQQVWGWFVPMIFPTLALMFATINFQSQPSDTAPILVNKRNVHICLLISIIYLLVLFIHVFFWPAFNYPDPLKLFTTANFYLAPIQALVISIMGSLFNKNKTL